MKDYNEEENIQKKYKVPIYRIIVPLKINV